MRDGNKANEILTQIFGTITFGQLAVDSFFIISGFLIVKSWKDKPIFTSFLLNRILRIYPGFICASLVCAFLIGPNYNTGNYFQNLDLSTFFLGVARLHLTGIPSVFDGTHNPELNGSLWTIPWEFKCYLLVLFCGFIGIIKRRWIWLSLFSSTLICYLAYCTGFLDHTIDLCSDLVMSFIAGGCFYLFKNSIPWNKNIAWIGVILFICALFISPLVVPALCIFWGYAVLYFANSGTLLLSFNRHPDISYGIYLYAWPINKILLWYFPMINLYLEILIVFLLSIIAGIFSWYLIERPSLMAKFFLQKLLTTRDDY